MLGGQPGAVFVCSRIGVLGSIGGNRLMQMGKFARRVRPLRPGRDIAQPISPLPRLGHIRNADAELRRDGTRTSRRRQHPITQVLSISLPLTPTHPSLRPMPDRYESQLRGVPESQISIPARVRRL
jgi:hypothetical protein